MSNYLEVMAALENKNRKKQQYEIVLEALKESEAPGGIARASFVTGEQEKSFKAKAEKGLSSYQEKKRQEEAEEKSRTMWERIMLGTNDAFLAQSDDPLATQWNTVVQDYRKDTSYKEISDQWTQEQKDEFGYLYSTDRVKADKYAEQVNNSIKRTESDVARKIIAESASESVGSGIAHTAAALLTAPLGLTDFLDNLAEFSGRGTITQKGGEMLSPFDYSQAVVGGITEKLNTEYGTIDEDVPVLGGKGLGDLYGLGFSAAQSLLSGATGGATTLVQFFGQAAAAGVDEKLDAGATGKQALGYGLVAGLAEAAAEKIGIDNLFKNSSARTLKDMMKNMLKQGASEGLEEGLTSVINTVADNLIMGDKSQFDQKVAQYEETMSTEEAKKKAFADMLGDIAFDMLGGMVTGTGTASIATTANSIRTGTNLVTGLTRNEKAVVDKVFNDRVTEAQKEGKVTARQKQEIYDKILKEMERGEMSTDTIEEVLGGEEYQQYKKAQEWKDSLQKDYDAQSKELETLRNTKAGELTDVQQERMQELKKTVPQMKKNLDNVTELSKKDDSRQRISNKVSEMVKSERLSESYAERGRRGEAYKADVSQYDEKQRQTIQKAIDSGILNNTRRTHEFVDLVAKISGDKGINFNFSDSAKLKETGFALAGKTVNGFVSKDGVTVNMNSAKALNRIVGHEVTHVLKGTELFEPLQSMLFEYAKTKGDYQSRVDTLTELYKDIQDADINEELTAELVGDYLFTDTEFLERLSTENRNAFQKVFDEIKYLCRVATAGSKDARQLEKVKKTFEEVYRTAKNTTLEDGVRYALAKIEEVTPNDEQKQRNVYEVARMGSVYTVDADKLIPGEKSIKDIYKEYISKWGENIHSEVFGDIAVRNSSIRSEMRHGSTPVKVASIEAIPSVIQNGKIVEWLKKDSGLFRIVVAAPIKIGETPYFMGVMLQRDDQNQRLYLHDVVIEKEASNLSQEHLDSTGSHEGKENLYTSSILENIAEVKRNGGRKFSLSSDSGNALVGGGWDVSGEDILLQDNVGDIPIRSDYQQSATDLGDVPIIEEYRNGKPAENPSMEGVPIREEFRDEPIVKPRIENRVYELDEMESQYQKEITALEEQAEKERTEAREDQRRKRRSDVRAEKMQILTSGLGARGFDLDEVLDNAHPRATFTMADNTPQRALEKTFGYEAGQALADLTVNQTAQNETEGIRWMNTITDRKTGLLAQLSQKYGIKPGSKESSAAQMYAEGFWVNEAGEYITYGDKELAADFPDANVQKNIKGLAKDDRVRQFYDDSLDAINASRERNGYDIIPKRKDYFLHFRAMDDTFSRLGIPFNPNDIKAKDLPTDLAGMTADLKPGQPFFSSSMQRKGDRTSYDLLGGIERYAASAKNQIFHIDDIQTLRALQIYVAQRFGRGDGLEGLDGLTDEQAEELIQKKFNNHLSTFASFLNTQANILAGKTSMIDRALSEGVLGRRVLTVMDTINKQVGSNMVGYNLSSAFTNIIPVVQTFARTNKGDFAKALAQTAANIIEGGKWDSFRDDSSVIVRRKGSDRFARTLWQKMSDPGYVLMGAVDNVSTEIIARTKFNELTRKGIDAETAHYETDKWVSRLMGDRSLGQMPQAYTSRMLGLLTKFQLEVRNQVDSLTYDVYQEARMKNKDVASKSERTARIAAKVISDAVQLAVAQHLFGIGFEAVAGYNPAFDIIEAIVTAFGWDDEEDSEDTVKDNLQQGLMTLAEDLPYTSMILDGGRIPISSALPIEQFITGTDDYGNEKSRWETVGEALPYYLLPGGYGQIKKTAQGLGMFYKDDVHDGLQNVDELLGETPANKAGGLSSLVDDIPIAGSYTDSGNLRFAVEETPLNVAQAALFGQYASEEARDYFDNNRTPLQEKQIQELVDTGMDYTEYRDYREVLAELESLSEKADFINSMDAPLSTKNILINNVADRKTPINMAGYDKYDSFEEFDWATKNPGKYKLLQEDNVTYRTYTLSKKVREAYDWAYQNPDKIPFAKTVAGDIVTYRQYAGELSDIKSDKDASGKSISGSRKKKVLAYINDLDADYMTKVLLWKSEYNSDDSYNGEIVDYLSSQKDLSYDDIAQILRELGFTVWPDGRVTW